MKPELTIGEWDIDPIEGQIRRAGEMRHLRPKAMAVLMCLAGKPGEMFERDEIIQEVWGRELVTDEPLTTCVAELRRNLEDQATQPRYIQTVPKRGYRLVAEVKRVVGTPVADHVTTDSSQGAGTIGPLGEAGGHGDDRSAPGRPRLGPLLFLLVAVAAIAFLLGREITEPDRTPTVALVPEVPLDPQAVPTIAVLPFINMSNEVQMDYLGEGIAEEIINGLTRVDGLRVRSRTSSFALKDEHLGATAIANRLGLSHLLDGSIRHSGDKLRISVQLIDLETDTPVWSEIFEKPAANLFELQGEIAASVSEALEVALDLQQRERLEDVGTTNPQAYQLYIRGRQQMARRTTVSLASAMGSFEQALAMDPDYAQAYLGLADANLLLPLYNNRPGADYLGKSLQAVEKALELDPDLGEAYATLGSVRDELRDFAGAEQAFKVALERAPRYPTTYHWYGFMLYRMARLEEADRMLGLAMEQDPLFSPLQYGMCANLVAMGRFDEAEAIYREIIAADPEFSWVYEGMGELYWTGRGDLAEATRWYELAFRYDPDTSYFPSRLAALYLDKGDVRKAAEWIDTAFEVEDQSFIARVHQALLDYYQGDAEAAYRLALGVLQDQPENYLALALARNHELTMAQPKRARERYAKQFPELFAPEPRIDPVNFQMAVDLVPVLRRTGEEELAERLLDLSWETARDYPRHGLPYRLSDVKILVLQDQNQAALDILERSVDSGWRPYWWFFMKHDPALEPLRGEPRFQQLITRLDAEGPEQ